MIFVISVSMYYTLTIVDLNLTSYRKKKNKNMTLLKCKWAKPIYYSQFSPIESPCTIIHLILYVAQFLSCEMRLFSSTIDIYQKPQNKLEAKRCSSPSVHPPTLFSLLMSLRLHSNPKSTFLSITFGVKQIP